MIHLAFASAIPEPSKTQIITITIATQPSAIIAKTNAFVLAIIPLIAATVPLTATFVNFSVASAVFFTDWTAFLALLQFSWLLFG